MSIRQLFPGSDNPTSELYSVGTGQLTGLTLCMLSVSPKCLSRFSAGDEFYLKRIAPTDNMRLWLYDEYTLAISG